MEKITQTSKSYFRLLRIIHFAITLGPLLFMAVVILSFQETDVAENDSVFFFATIVVSLAASAGHFIVISKFRQQAMKLKDLKRKMNIYRTLVIVRNAMVEFPSIMAIAAYMNGAYEFILMIPASALVLQLATIPSETNAVKTLKLSRDEELQLKDPEAIISEYTRTYSNN